MMNALFIALYGVLGAVVGSFLNVCIDRLPANQSLVTPASHCPVCRHRLKPHHMIPIVSYLWLKGKCRTCGALIPRRILLVECLSAMVFAFLMWRFTSSIHLVIATFYTCLLIVIAVIDFERGLILNRLTYPGIIASLAMSLFIQEVGIYKAVLGGITGAGLIMLVVVASRGGMGMGDVKMAALLGTMLGLPMVLVALLLAVITGGLVAATLLGLKIKGRKDTIAFGPFLAAGGWIALVSGNNILGLLMPSA